MARDQHESTTEVARERFMNVVLAGIAADGFPRVSGYTCDVYERDGLIEKTDDDRHPYRLTTAGMARLEWAEEVSA